MHSYWNPNCWISSHLRLQALSTCISSPACDSIAICGPLTQTHTICKGVWNLTQNFHLYLILDCCKLIKNCYNCWQDKFLIFLMIVFPLRYGDSKLYLIIKGWENIHKIIHRGFEKKNNENSKWNFFIL